MKVFLLEDDYLLNKAMTHYLSSKGFDVSSFRNGVEALHSISNDFEVMILDIDIPEFSGIQLLEEIRRLYPLKPIIMISGTIDIEIIVKAYQKGANDYMKKPFDIRELEMKINAFTPRKSNKYHLGHGVEYDPLHHQLFWNHEEIFITPKERKLLHILIENQGRVVKSETLEIGIWGYDNYSGNLRQLVARLRKKLPENIIQNHSGNGYCIV